MQQANVTSTSDHSSKFTPRSRLGLQSTAEGVIEFDRLLMLTSQQPNAHTSHLNQRNSNVKQVKKQNVVVPPLNIKPMSFPIDAKPAQEQRSLTEGEECSTDGAVMDQYRQKSMTINLNEPLHQLNSSIQSSEAVQFIASNAESVAQHAKKQDGFKRFQNQFAANRPRPSIPSNHLEPSPDYVPPNSSHYGQHERQSPVQFDSLNGTELVNKRVIVHPAGPQDSSHEPKTTVFSFNNQQDSRHMHEVEHEHSERQFNLNDDDDVRQVICQLTSQQPDINHMIKFVRGRLNVLEREIEEKGNETLEQEILERLPREHTQSMLMTQLTQYQAELVKLQVVHRQNDERKDMLLEDMACHNQQLMKLVMERERFEHLTGLSPADDNAGLVPTEKHLLAQFLRQYLTSVRDDANLLKGIEAEAFQLLLDFQKRQVLLSLIRQLQQYMLSLNSGTTDASYANSDNLDVLYHRITASETSITEAVQAVGQQAQRIIAGTQNQNGQQQMSMPEEPQVALQHQIDEYEATFDVSRARAMIAEVWRGLQTLRQKDKRIDQLSAVVRGKLKAQIEAIESEQLVIDKVITQIQLAIIGLEQTIREQSTVAEQQRQSSSVNKLLMHYNQLSDLLDEAEGADSMFNAQQALNVALDLDLSFLKQPQQRTLSLDQIAPVIPMNKLGLVFTPQCMYGQTQSSRISNIQSRGLNLEHGKILSPSSKKKENAHDQDYEDLQNMQGAQSSVRRGSGDGHEPAVEVGAYGNQRRTGIEVPIKMADLVDLRQDAEQDHDEGKFLDATMHNASQVVSRSTSGLPSATCSHSKNNTDVSRKLRAPHTSNTGVASASATRSSARPATGKHTRYGGKNNKQPVIPFPSDAESGAAGDLRAGHPDLRLAIRRSRPRYDPYEKDSVRKYESINFIEKEQQQYAQIESMRRRRISKSKTTAISTLNHDIDAVVVPPTASDTLLVDQAIAAADLTNDAMLTAPNQQKTYDLPTFSSQMRMRNTKDPILVNIAKIYHQKQQRAQNRQKLAAQQVRRASSQTAAHHRSNANTGASLKYMPLDTQLNVAQSSLALLGHATTCQQPRTTLNSSKPRNVLNAYSNYSRGAGPTLADKHRRAGSAGTRQFDDGESDFGRHSSGRPRARQPQIINQSRSGDRHSANAFASSGARSNSQSLQTQNRKIKNLEPSIIQQSNSMLNLSTSGNLNFKKMCKITDLKQVASLCKVSQRMRHSTTAGGPLSRSSGYLTRELNDLKVAHQISKGRSDSRFRQQNSRASALKASDQRRNRSNSQIQPSTVPRRARSRAELNRKPIGVESHGNNHSVSRRQYKTSNEMTLTAFRQLVQAHSMNTFLPEKSWQQQLRSSKTTPHLKLAQLRKGAGSRRAQEGLAHRTSMQLKTPTTVNMMSEPPNINLSCYLNMAPKDNEEHYNSDVRAAEPRLDDLSLQMNTPVPPPVPVLDNAYQSQQFTHQIQGGRAESFIAVSNKYKTVEPRANNLRKYAAPPTISSQMNHHLSHDTSAYDSMQVQQTTMHSHNDNDGLIMHHIPNNQRQNVKLEFKRYEPSKNGLETYVARVPAHQQRIIHFFTMVKPLIEGCNFTLVPSATALKLELAPRSLHKLNVLEYGDSRQPRQFGLLVADIATVSVADSSVDDIKRYKQLRERRQRDPNWDPNNSLNQTQEMFEFAFDIVLKKQQPARRLVFATRNYNDLKRWVLGLSVLLENQRSLSKLCQMMQMQK